MFFLISFVFKIHTNACVFLSGSTCAAVPLLTIQESLEMTRDMLSKLVLDEPSLDSKIEKKKQELERNQKRFRSVQSVRSVHSLEERLEG